ncbi:hypothetical protein [Nonlabens dokdonensis]|uniref:hypothetical protein n=1 Tax=Nonlabens dokdonensis TaxID=328515 RepID=UPI0026E959BA|nr:hypothetical protein [Nonlabens dokdonensis]
MITIEIKEAGKTFYLPQSLEDCDREQARAACFLFAAYNDGFLSYVDMRQALLYQLLGLNMTMDHNQEGYEDVITNIALLSERMDGFFDFLDDGKAVIKANFKDNPFLWLRPSIVKYHGPIDQFDNISFGQYLDALEAFIDFSQTGEESYLNTLIAICYMKKLPLSRKLQPYNTSLTLKRARKFSHLDRGYRYGFYLYFASFQAYLTTAKMHVHGNELDLSILFNPIPGAPQVKSNIAGLGMLGVAHEMAQSGIYGSMDSLRNKPLWDVLPLMHNVRKGHIDDYVNSKKSL